MPSNPSPPSLLERVRGRRTRNIDLPAESPRDPRLKGTTVGEALGRAREGIKTLRKKGLLGGKR